MELNYPFHSIQKIIFNFLERGTHKYHDIVERQRVIYFNVLLIALPIVYLVFVIIDLKNFIKPLSTWYFDQFGFFLFVFVCLLCYILSYNGAALFSKIIFLVSWPLIMHIGPIIIQHTPPDYYYAFPMGIVFHSIMIQVVFNPRKSAFILWSMLLANFILILFSLKILHYFDWESDPQLPLFVYDDYFLFVIILYWLLFNMVIFYLMRIIDSNLHNLYKSRQIIENQKNNLESTIEKLKTSQNQLIQSEKLASLGVFTAGISHELNNPINYIASGASGLFKLLDSLRTDFLKCNPELAGKFKNIDITREAIEIGVDKASRIISSLRNYTHPGNDMYTLYNSINSMSDALVLLEGTYKDRINIIKNYQPELLIECRADKLHQLFLNLLSNAVQAIEGTGEIKISARIDSDQIAVFEIADTGCGIEKEMIKQVFDPFFTTKEIGQGTGLGLFIVHNIVQEHNGRIELESEPGKGSVFRIYLPLRQEINVSL